MLNTLRVDNEKFAHENHMYRLKPQTDIGIDIIAECKSAIQELEKVLQHIREAQAPQAPVKPLPSAQLSLIHCYKGNNNYHINGDDIESVKSSVNTGVHLMMKDGREYHTNRTLKDLEKESLLIRCDIQHLINMKCIKMVERTHNGRGVIHTYSGHRLPVSRRRMKSITQFN